ncbi:expressed unknown protein [Seminavis robusta]|uniref:Uncharacterized protein n=1 Tax=Seminavis robusta TaxID=568900 RepID=A0A9N8E3Y5_9STRA|nr:expressed unknown protein [Seminavis robusta]|eukprot:Sro527_g160640.1 n/a (365) ;mRNA; f:25496-26590
MQLYSGKMYMLTSPLHGSSADGTVNPTQNDPGLDRTAGNPFNTDPVNIDELVQAFRHRGGVIIFLHNPKAGGSTVRELIQSQAYEVRNGDKLHQINPQNAKNNIAYWGTHTVTSWKASKLRIDALLSQQAQSANGTIFILEDHVFPDIINVLIPSLKKWRAKSKANNIPLLVVAQIREPVSHFVSYFNYYHVRTQKAAPTQESLVKFARENENLQCQWFVNRVCPNDNIIIMRQLLQLVLHEIDWIFDTATFAQELLPLLTYMTKLQLRDLGIVQPVGYYDYHGEKLKVIDLSQETLRILREQSVLDRELYDNVTRHYRDFSKWRDYLTAKKAFTKCSWYPENQTCVYPGGEAVSPGNLPAYLL